MGTGGTRVPAVSRVLGLCASPRPEWRQGIRRLRFSKIAGGPCLGTSCQQVFIRCPGSTAGAVPGALASALRIAGGSKFVAGFAERRWGFAAPRPPLARGVLMLGFGRIEWEWGRT